MRSFIRLKLTGKRHIVDTHIGIEFICEFSFYDKKTKFGIIRGGDEFMKFGDAFTFGDVVVMEGGTLYVKGMVGVLSKTIKSDIKELMKTYGLKRIEWERIKDKKLTIIKKSLKRSYDTNIRVN